MKKRMITLLVYIISVHATPSLETAIEYQKNEQFCQAIACYEELLTDTPSDINAYFNMGCCCLAIGHKEKAIEAFTKVLELNPHALAAKYNLGYTYKTFGDIDTAITIYKEIISENPDYEPAQLALGFAYITQGDFEQGWQQHARYLAQSGKNGDKLRSLLETNDIPYKKILLRLEGGLGDTLNFVRYAELLKNMGADVIVNCQTQLVPLLSRCIYIDQLIPSGTSIPSYDAEATLMSLPAIFADTTETVPHTIPYLFANPTLIKHWETLLAHDNNFKVGICWQVDLHNDMSKLPIARRGYPLECFSLLGDLENVSFYSLQKYNGIEQLATLPTHFTLHTFEHLDEQSGPFMDTAALIKNLDLVITVDTAVAHLAGALGCNVWLLHPYATADWRWIHGRTDSYWYPTMRIFRQQKPFGYDDVIKNIKNELAALIQQK